MAGPRSQQLAFSNALVDGVPFSAYTSPAGITTLVKDWRLCVTSSPSAHAYVYVIKGAAMVIIAAYLSVPINQPVAERGAQLVLEPGDNFGVIMAGGTGAFLASGMVLQGT
jgi:hypothetical protein